MVRWWRSPARIDEWQLTLQEVGTLTSWQDSSEGPLRIIEATLTTKSGADILVRRATALPLNSLEFEPDGSFRTEGETYQHVHHANGHEETVKINTTHVFQASGPKLTQLDAVIRVLRLSEGWSALFTEVSCRAYWRRSFDSTLERCANTVDPKPDPDTGRGPWI